MRRLYLKTEDDNLRLSLNDFPKDTRKAILETGFPKYLTADR
jgi:hypothetical protein